MKDSDEFLEHFGVKGMKWGTRRNNAALQRQASSMDGRTTQGKQVKKMASESQRIAAAGLTVGKMVKDSL